MKTFQVMFYHKQEPRRFQKEVMTVNLDAFQHPTAENVARNVIACAMVAMGVKKKSDLGLWGACEVEKEPGT